MTLEEYKKMLDDQKRCCAICNRVMDKPHVDHDHETGKVRQLLCRECNCALGLLREDIRIAEGMITYLRKWKQ